MRLGGISLTPWDKKQNVWKPWTEYPTYDPNAPRNELGVRYDADKYAADTYSVLTRDQWDTYVRNFIPVENNLISYATDWSKPQQAADAAIGDVREQFAAAPAIAERRARAQGITYTPEEARAIERNSKLNQSLAEVHAGNASRDATLSRQRQIMGAGTGGII